MANGKEVGSVKGGGAKPSPHAEDKKSRGFSQSGIPSKTNAALQDNLAQDTMGKGQDSMTGPHDAMRG